MLHRAGFLSRSRCDFPSTMAVMKAALSVFSTGLLLFASVFGNSGQSARSFEWQVVTQGNFSSEIRAHTHILLIVTVPWCGESRTLMKELKYQVAAEQEKFGHLRLMTLYRSNDKLLADVLGAADGIAIYFYLNSVAYRYRGRLRMQNIYTSLNHLISLKPDDLPLKNLRTENDLNIFLQSTDKAVLLFEFCGWTSRLISKSDFYERKSAFHMQYPSENDEIDVNILSDAHKKSPFDLQHNLKEKRIDSFTCAIENGVPWFRAFQWEKETSPLHGNEYEQVNDGMSCTFEDFQQFQSFFSNFTKTAREYFFPPERQRFGLVNNRFLLSLLGVENLHAWSLMLHFTGCPNCSKILRIQDDINRALQMHHILVSELDGGGCGDLESKLPGNRPSVILFVDRSSLSTEIRRKSEMALDIFRNFSLSYQKEYENTTIEGLFTQTLSPVGGEITSGQSDHSTRKLSPPHKALNFPEKMTFMIIKEGENKALDNIPMAEHRNSVQDILNFLVEKKNPTLPMKDSKMSIIAKEVGFQLLSDDFKVKIVKELPEVKEDNQMDKDSSVELKNLEMPDTSIKSKGESEADLESENLFMTTTDIAAQGGEPSELVNVEPSSQSNQDNTANTETNVQPLHLKIAEESSERKLLTVESMSMNESDHNSYRENVGSSIDNEQQLHLESRSSGMPSLTENVHIEPGSDFMNSNEALDNFIDDSLHTSIVENVSKETHLTMMSGKVKEQDNQIFRGSFFFSDGGYSLLRSLTSGSKIPSIVILDPVLQQHYVSPEEMFFNYSSLVDFVDRFLKGSLPSFQRVETVPFSPRENPRPPFVNLDFREADSIPRVTLDTFSKMVLGYNQCDIGYMQAYCDNQDIGPAWKKDVLVLFSNSWCGFCQRAELVVREVYRAFKGYKNLWTNDLSTRSSMPIEDDFEDAMGIALPSIFLMDCTLNDCSQPLQFIGQEEVYPALMLFPAETKDAVSFEGSMSVSSIIEFISIHGSNLRHLIASKEILWAGVQEEKSTCPSQEESSDPVHEESAVKKSAPHEVLLNITGKTTEKSHGDNFNTSNVSDDVAPDVGVGSVLIATDALHNASPFDNSRILIVKADYEHGFEGLIINKRIDWNVVQPLVTLKEGFESLKEAPLFFGGPVLVPSMPLISFARRANDFGYFEIVPGFYYGDQMATVRAIEGVNSRNLSANDLWFFLGYSSWGWDQLFAEVAAGAWNISDFRREQLKWLEY